MSNLVTITNTKENILEFSVDVEGITAENLSIQFVIKGKDVNFSFDAKKSAGNSWSVVIPALSVLERTAYPFYIDATVDGYHFQPLKGTVNVIGSTELYATTPKNVTIAPGSVETDKKTNDIKKSEDKKEDKVSETSFNLSDLLKTSNSKTQKKILTSSSPFKMELPPIDLKLNKKSTVENVDEVKDKTVKGIIAESLKKKLFVH